LKSAEKYFERIVATNNEAERAFIYQKLRLEHKLKSPAISKKLGFRDAQVRHYIRVADKLCDQVMLMLSKGAISFSHARSIASLPLNDQETTARDVIFHKETVVALRKKLSSKDGEESNFEIEKLAEIISQKTGLEVNIVMDGKVNNSGRVELRFHDLNGFDSITHRLRVNLDEEF
jgi:ParB-like chromosome segregation protein Spo0J